MSNAVMVKKYQDVLLHPFQFAIVQYVSQHAFKVILTHNPLRRWIYEQEGQSSRRNVMTKYVPVVCILHAAVRTL